MRTPCPLHPLIDPAQTDTCAQMVAAKKHVPIVKKRMSIPLAQHPHTHTTVERFAVPPFPALPARKTFAV